MTGLPLHTMVLAALVGTIAVARAVRLITADAYPPAVWLRVWWANHTDTKVGSWRADWGPLLTCPFCLAPYAVAVDLGWAWWSGLAGWWGTAWWLVNLWAAVSYAAAMVVVRDEPPED